MKSILGSSMRACLIVGLIALLVPSAYAHTYLSTVVLGGSQLSQGDCVRAHPANGFDSPVSSITSSDMTCGFLPSAAKAANRACPISAGSSIGIIWHHNSNSASDDIIDASHKGPVIFYLAKSSSGSGNVWFKIYQDGYNPSTKQWATDRLRSNKGLVTFTIPSDISPGNYLLRGEILALHEANTINKIQPYVGCVELAITGSGSANPSGVAFPGAYKASDAGILFNVYTTISSYPIPGPALYTSGSSSSSSGSSTPVTSAPATQAPTTRPSTPVTPAPTTRPSTPAPTTRPATPATPAPTTRPSTSGSSSGSNSLKLQLNSGSNAYWMAVAVTGGSQTTSKVEVMESGSKSWSALSNQGWAFIFSKSSQMKMPISLRLTSSSGKQVTLSNVYSSMSATSVINTGKDYSNKRRSADMEMDMDMVEVPETEAEVEEVPVDVEQVQAEENAMVVVSVFPSATPSWFAVQVRGVEDIASVELMDSAVLSSYAFMSLGKWGYELAAPEGAEFVTPLTVRVTNAAGDSFTAPIESIAPHTLAFAEATM